MKRIKLKQLMEDFDPGIGDAIPGPDETSVGEDIASRGESFTTWQEFVSYLIDNDAAIPYILFIIYIGGIANKLPQKNGGLDFNAVFSNHSQISTFQNALKTKIGEAFSGGVTFYAGGGDGTDGYNPALYTLINDASYSDSSVGYYARVMKNLIKSYINYDLSTEDLVLMTVGNAGIGGKEIYGPGAMDPGTITYGAEFAIKHPKYQENGRVEFLDPYDFNAFYFAEYMPKSMLTSPHTVSEDVNSQAFNTFYSIDGSGIPGNEDAVLASSLKEKISTGELKGFPGSIEEMDNLVAAEKSGVPDEDIGAPKRESVIMSKKDLNKLITELLFFS